MNRDRKLCDMAVALARMGGSGELLREVIEIVRADLPAAMARLRAAAVARNPAEVQVAAHALQGMAVTFNAQLALAIAGRLEKMGMAGDLSPASEALEELEREIALLDQELLAELAKT